MFNTLSSGMRRICHDIPSFSTGKGCQFVFRQNAWSLSPRTRFFSSTIPKHAFTNSPCLILAEHDGNKLTAGTLSTITAAKLLSDKVTVLVTGSGLAPEVAKHAATIEGVFNVVVADSPEYKHNLAESLSDLIMACQKLYNSAYILAPCSTFGKDVAPRVAALLDVQPISDIISIKAADTFVRPTYAGNILATIKSKDAIRVITVRGTAFEKSKEKQGLAQILPVAKEAMVAHQGPMPTWIKEEIKKSERPDLQSASIVVSGGRGMKSGENFKILEALADQLGAAVGASRAAVDAGYVANDMQVGQTGKIVAPDLYIAVGISGAIQHLAGMKDSKVIVAINKDAEAPIFTVSDYGIVADLFQVVPEMTQLIQKIKSS